ncbi:hypothetical protein Leryth_012366 [Lithospermum erythrorhizon]|nr:hypothetical protein Leryth_012366 [Lithospermum erythrorhizon]
MAQFHPLLEGGRRRGGAKRDQDYPFFSTPSDIWDPLEFGGAVTSWRHGDDIESLAHASVDWRETNQAHIFRIDLPGVKKEDLKVQVEDDNTIEISGERVKEQEEGNDKWHRVERKRGRFMRRFRLPENIKAEEINCGLEHGVLTVTAPKMETQETPRNVRYIDVA